VDGKIVMGSKGLLCFTGRVAAREAEGGSDQGGRRRKPQDVRRREKEREKEGGGEGKREVEERERERRRRRRSEEAG